MKRNITDIQGGNVIKKVRISGITTPPDTVVVAYVDDDKISQLKDECGASTDVAVTDFLNDDIHYHVCVTSKKAPLIYDKEGDIINMAKSEITIEPR